MRISPIQTFSRPNLYNSKPQAAKPLQSNPSAQVPAELADITHNKAMINFKGIHPSSMALSKHLPLEDRLASLFEILNYGDVILVGKSLKDVQKALKANAGAIKQVIKKATFVPEDNIDGVLAFFKHNTGETEVLNPNKESLLFRSGREEYPLKSGESFYLTPGDTIQLKNLVIQYKEHPKADLSLGRSLFSTVFNYENEAKDVMKKHNMKMFTKLAQEKRGTNTVTFKDVGGQDEAIKELKRGIIYPIKNPEAFENMEINRGYILYGPSGTGKTHLARALANECDAHFMQINGAEMESKFIGESEENWRTLFAEAVENQPTIMFLDEFDNVAKKRNTENDPYGAKVTNQILTLMTDIDNNKDDVFVIAATNKLDVLDEAIKRSGRFGKWLEMQTPDLKGVKQIFQIHAKNKPIESSLDLEKYYKKMHDLNVTGADIRAIINNAYDNSYERLGIYAKMDEGTFKPSDMEDLKITQPDLEEALEKFTNMRKPQRKSVGFINK